MLTFNDTQMQFFARDARTRVAERFAADLARLAPQHAQAMGEALAVEFALEVIARAARARVHQQETVYLWFEASVLWGIGFAADPLFAKAAEPLHAPWNELQRMRDFHARFVSFQAQTCGEEGTRFQAVLTRLEGLDDVLDLPAQKPDSARVAAILTQIWPERAEAAGASALQNCAAAGLKQAAKLGLSDPRDMVSIAILRYILGAEWGSDPQYAWFVRGAAEAAGLPNRAKAYLREALRHAVL